jgi:hypothetical protein
MNNEEALERGTGRTTRLIKALPFGAGFIIHPPELKRMFEQWAAEQGREDICIGTLGTLKTTCVGRSHIGIDHYVIESGGLLDLNDEERQAIRRRNVYVLDEMNMPTCIEGMELV